MKFAGPLSLDDFQRTLNVNLVGTFNVCRLAAERMAAQEPYNESGERGGCHAQPGQTGKILNFLKSYQTVEAATLILVNHFSKPHFSRARICYHQLLIFLAM